MKLRENEHAHWWNQIHSPFFRQKSDNRWQILNAFPLPHLLLEIWFLNKEVQ